MLYIHQVFTKYVCVRHHPGVIEPKVGAAEKSIDFRVFHSRSYNRDSFFNLTCIHLAPVMGYVLFRCLSVNKMDKNSLPSWSLYSRREKTENKSQQVKINR